MNEKKIEDYIGVGTDETVDKIKYKTSGVIVEFIIPKPRVPIISDIEENKR